MARLKKHGEKVDPIDQIGPIVSLAERQHLPYIPTCSAAYVLKRDSANDITITQMFITLAIMLEVYSKL